MRFIILRTLLDAYLTIKNDTGLITFSIIFSSNDSILSLMCNRKKVICING